MAVSLHRGETAGPSDLIKGGMDKAKEGVSHIKSEEERGGSLAGAIEACVRARAMQNFFETGTLLTMSQVQNPSFRPLDETSMKIICLI